MKTSIPFARRVTQAAHTVAGGLLLAATGLALAVDWPKEGSVSLTKTITVTAPAAFDSGGEKWSAIFDARVVALNDAGSGIFHQTVGHCIGLDTGGGATGVCLWTDADGDRFTETFTRAPGGLKAVGTLSDGTGKYRGIEATGEGVETRLPDSAPGQRNLIAKGRVTYRLR